MRHHKYSILFSIFILFILFSNCDKKDATSPKDTTSPIVAITSPIDGSVVHETINIIISVSDNSEIDKVQLLIDGIEVNNLKKENDLYKYSWETYSIENGTEHTLIARATDSEGNTGQSDIIAVTVNNEGFSPQSVILQSPVVSGSNITLNWSASNDADFDHYELLRTYAEVDTYSVVFSDSSSQKVVFTDSVIQNTSYEYYIKVVDKAGLFSESNHQTVEYTQFLPPIPQNFSAIVNGCFIDLSWNPIDIPDFSRYVILKKTTNISQIDSIIIKQMSESSYSDSVSQFNEYEYSLITFDDFGNFVISDKFSFSLSDFQPQTPIMYDPIIDGSNISLKWSKNTDVDFLSYQVYRSQNGSDMELINQIQVQDDTTLIDEVTQGLAYLYLVTVNDKGGLQANSNTISISAADFSPNPVQLISIDLNGDVISLEWSQNSDTDFKNYRIEQSKDGGTFENLFEVPERTTLLKSFSVEQYHDYSYRIICIDIASLKAESNILQISKENFLPNDVNFISANLSGDVITLNWQYLPDIDFKKFEIVRNNITIAEIPDSLENSFQDIVVQGQDYNYQVKVVDTAELENISNTKTILSNEFYPPSVEINNISYNGSGILIEWTPSSIPDYHSIKIFRSTDSSFTDITIIQTITDKNQAEYIDYSIQTENSRYFYKLEINDTGNLSAISNWKYLSFYDEILICSEYDGNQRNRDLVMVECDGYNKRKIWSKDAGTGASSISVSVSPNGKYGFMRASDGWYFIDILQEKTTFVKNCEFSVSDHNQFWTFDNSKVYFADKGLYEYNVQNNTVNLIDSNAQDDMSYSKDANLLVYRKSRSIYKYDGFNYSEVIQFQEPERPVYLKINPIGTKVYFYLEQAHYPSIRSVDLIDGSITEVPETNYTQNQILLLNAFSTFISDNLIFCKYSGSQGGGPGMATLNLVNGNFNLAYSYDYSSYPWGLCDMSNNFSKVCFNKVHSIVVLNVSDFSIFSEIDGWGITRSVWVKNRWSSN